MPTLGMRPSYIEQEPGMSFIREAGRIDLAGQLQGFASVAKVSGCGYGMKLGVGRAELGVKVVAVSSNSLGDATCGLQLSMRVRSITFPGADGGLHEVHSAEQRKRLRGAVWFGCPGTKSFDGKGRHSLCLVKPSKAQEGMRHSEASGDDFQLVA